MTLADPAEDHDRDHWVERPADWAAGACDRGIRHARNDDALALAAAAEPGTFAVLVVCDGVSTAPGSDVASLAAATAARDVLAGASDGPSPSPGDAAGWDGRFVVAAQAAVDAIVASGAPVEGATPPSCTLAAVVVDGPAVVVGWIGDSRVYWLPDTGQARRLTVDDSWAQAMIEAGVPREEAENAPNAHAITRWLGPDDSDHEPRRVSFDASASGWLLACTDGLWNYASEADELADVVRSAMNEVGADPGDVAAHLVGWANAQGGHDNITVALARL